MKKLLLAVLLSVNLIAGGTFNTIPVSENNTSYTVKEDKRTYFEIAMGKPVKPLTDEELMNRVIYTNLIGVGVIAVWGTVFWDYFESKPKFGEEGWFGKDTKYGGADKLGHMYATYLWSLGFSSLFEYWGMSKDQSLIYGPLTSWIFQGMMELGDSFSSSEGFSYEDLIMNTVGAGFYYVRERYPSVKEKLDFRLEYVPDLNSNQDAFTQYNSMKYLLHLNYPDLRV